MTVLAGIFWLCLASVAYAYAGYPLCAWGLSRMFGSQRRPPPRADDGALPTVTLLIAAHNEEAVIADRVEDALRADYPAERFRIVVATDGCSDRTAEIVKRYAGRGVGLMERATRSGKSSVINAAMADIDTDVVLLSDANTRIDPAAVRQLSRWFADPSVGCVCGRLVLTDPATGRNVDSLYWTYETFLKKCDARLGGLLGSNGAIYAIRRAWYVPIPGNTIVDDFVIPLLMKQATGCDLVYDAAAVASEESANDVKDEFRRRARIGAGGFQAIVLLWKLLDPRRGWVAFTFLSHKVMRWLCPFFLVGMLVTNVTLVRWPLYRLTLAAQILFYGCSLLASWVPGGRRGVRILRLGTMFTSMNAALLVGFWRWLRGRQKGAWDRTRRGAEQTT